MRRTRLVLGLLALFGVAAASLLGARPASASDAGGAWLTRINDLRATRGVAALIVDEQASTVAQQWTDHMASTSVLAHNPNVASQVSAPRTSLGENVGYGGSVDEIFTAFVGSPGHYANLVNPAYDHVGIGHAVDATGRIWTTHVFAREGAATTASPAPTAAPAPPANQVTTCRGVRGANRCTTTTRRVAARRGTSKGHVVRRRH